MRKLIDLFNTKDARHILDCEELPEGYPIELLNPIIDDIMIEHGKLIGFDYYNEYITQAEDSLFLRIKIETINISIIAFSIGKDKEAIELQTGVGLKCKSIPELEQKVRQITRDARLQAAKKLEENNTKDIISWADKVAWLEYILKKDIDNDITVERYYAFERLANKKLEIEKAA